MKQKRKGIGGRKERRKGGERGIKEEEDGREGESKKIGIERGEKKRMKKRRESPHEPGSTETRGADMLMRMNSVNTDSYLFLCFMLLSNTRL